MNTDFLSLILTDRSETDMTFLEWRTLMNGADENSNMWLIDRAISRLNTAIGGKADGLSLDPETGILQLTSGGKAIEGASITIDLKKYYTAIEQLNSEIFNSSVGAKNVEISATSEINFAEAKVVDYTGALTTSTAFSTYWFTVSQNCEIWLKDGTYPTGYTLYISIYNGDIGTSTFIKRYRSDDGNIPSQSSKLSITKGQTVAVSASSKTPTWVLSTSMVSDSNINKLLDAQKFNSVVFNKQGNLIKITQGKSQYWLKLDTSPTANLNTWRLTRQYINDDIVWDQIDIEGPLKEDGTSDFISGYHGDEAFTDITVIADGKILDLDKNYADTVLTNLTAFIKSNVYYCGDTDNVAFERYKKLEFKNHSLIVSNRWVYVNEKEQPFVVHSATGAGIWSIFTDQINGYSTNIDCSLKNNVSTPGGNNLNEVTIYGKSGFTVTVKGLTPNLSDSYSGTVTYFADEPRPRIKPYFMNVYAGKAKQTLNTGDELNTSFIIIVD